MSTSTTPAGAGHNLANKLSLKIVGTEGHDLKVGCVACTSSDGGRVHKDTGAYHCYVCGRGLSGFDLSKLVLGDHQAAIQTMIDVGLFEPYMRGNNNPSTPAGNGKTRSDDEIIEAVAKAKGCTLAGFKAYGAVVRNSRYVVFPTYRLDGPDQGGCVSHFSIDSQDPKAKGLNAKDKPAGVFLPKCSPKPGEEWLVAEGAKNGAAYHSLGYKAIGLNGHHIKKEFRPGLVASLKDVHVILVPDGDAESVDSFCALGKDLRGVATSVKIAALPLEMREKGGQDVRDVLKAEGPDAVHKAIREARPVGPDGKPGPTIPPPCSLRELVSSHPTLRPPIIEGLLRQGETMNIIAAPKKGKSWLANGLALSVSAGSRWLDTFPCTQGRVLLIDGELHPEVIAHRLPAVADALGIGPEYLDLIDVLPLRGFGVDLLQLGSFIESVEPGRYALAILDAFYRFLPVGFSENDNAQVMTLYNTIDTYAGRLKAAWVNIHHASKGDQSGKSTTDVGSGAGSQSRAADTHLIIRQHEQDNVAVIEAVVRSWPPVNPIAIRWTFPAWELDSGADPRKIQRSRERTSRENKDVHLAEDRQSVVNAMVQNPGPQTKTFIRDTTRIGNPRFGFAWASLIADSTVVSSGDVQKGNNRTYEGFILSQTGMDQ